MLSIRTTHFPWMDTDHSIYLNAASAGPLPSTAVDVADTWARLRRTPQLLPLPMLQAAVATARTQFAECIGADADEIALMPNTTYGLNLAARALPLRPGTILTFDGEFPSCVYPFQALASRGISLELVPRVNGLPDEDTLVKKIGRGDVVAVVISWVQFSTGYVADLRRIGNACRAHGVFFIVDGIQGCGVLPINVHELPIDMFASGAQKWLLGPWGTGFVYVRRELIQQIEPHDVGWACMRASADYGRLTDYEFDFFPDARRFEVVTLAYQDFAVANAATTLLLEIGVPQIAAHCASLITRVVDWVQTRRDVRLVSAIDSRRRAGIVAFAPNDLSSMSDRLQRANVIHGTREGAIRLSPHCYNTSSEIEEVIRLLEG